MVGLLRSSRKDDTDTLSIFTTHGSMLSFFFFNDTAPTEIYTLSLHDALPISGAPRSSRGRPTADLRVCCRCRARDRKSTRLNSSHSQISYAVFCLKKKKNKNTSERPPSSIVHLTRKYTTTPHISSLISHAIKR